MTNPLVMELDAAHSFLAAPHIGMLAVERRSGPPIGSPVCYGYEPGGDVVFSIGRNSAKAKALRAAGVASLYAHRRAGAKGTGLTRTFLSGCRDLNPGPLDPQSSALTKLRHSPWPVTLPPGAVLTVRPLCGPVSVA